MAELKNVTGTAFIVAEWRKFIIARNLDFVTVQEVAGATAMGILGLAGYFTSIGIVRAGRYVSKSFRGH